MLKIKQKGTFNKTEKFLKNAQKKEYLSILNSYGRDGVRALGSATPVDSGLTASSWSYEVQILRKGYAIVWTNSNVVGGTSVAILLQYGHGTKNGGYVQGRDFINPALQPIFDKMADQIWKEVTK